MKEYILRAQGNISVPALDIVCDSPTDLEARYKAIKIVKTLFGTYSTFFLYRKEGENDWAMVEKYEPYQPALEIDIKEY